MTNREVMQQALDALVAAGMSAHKTKQARENAAEMLRNELAKPAAVPDEWDKAVAYAYGAGYECGHHRTVEGFYSADSTGVAWEWVGDNKDEVRAMLAASPQPPAPAVDAGNHPLDSLHINRGSLDAAADAYEFEFDKAKCREAFDNFYHKIKASVSYDEWQAIWFKALEHERRKTAPAVDVEAVREVTK